MVWCVVEICLVTDSAPNIATDDGTRMAVCTIAHYYSFADQLSFVGIMLLLQSTVKQTLLAEKSKQKRGDICARGQCLDAVEQ